MGDFDTENDWIDDLCSENGFGVKLTPPAPLNFIATDVAGERYVILYTGDNTSEAIRTLGRWASNPELSFGWDHAAAMSSRIRSGT